MAKSDAITKMRDRMRNQAAQAHLEPEQAQPIVEPVPEPPKPAPSPPAPVSEAPLAPIRPRRRRDSKWVNPYPDAKPFQVSIYLTEDDLELIKSLRLKLHYSKEWMVLKRALETLDNEVEKGGDGKNKA